ncbi:DUF2780 domain-containing protein [Colwelliaceae bacterium BS250]
MKKTIIFLAISTLSFSAIAEESSWLDDLKNFVGLGDDKTQTAAEDTPETPNTDVLVAAKDQSLTAETSAMPSTDGLVSMLTSSLGVSTDQASGGMGAIFNYVKDNVSMDQFSQLTGSLPGVDGLIGQMPDISQLSSGSSEGYGGLLDKASEYSDSVKSVNDVKKQFEALGLKPEMISSFVSSAQSYLDTEPGQQAKQVLTDGIGKLVG